VTTPSDIREHYDSLALIYRTFWGEHIHHGFFRTAGDSPQDAQVNLVERCIGLLSPESIHNVLDVGCGFGATLLHVAKTFNAHGMGLTISPKQAQIALHEAHKAGLGDPLQFLVADAESFDFPASAFDLVWAMESSEHFAEKAGFFCNVQKTLRPAGQLLLTTWNGDMRSQAVAAVAQAFLCPELWTVEQYRNAIESTGMRIQDVQDLTSNVVPTWTICEERLAAVDRIAKLMPRRVREFLGGISVILNAYRSGDLTYNVFVAQK